MWGSCFSLGSRRSCSRSRRAASSPHHTTTHHSSTSHTSLITSLITSHSSHHNSSQLHFSHITYHISHHILLITPQLITAPLLTPHLSHLSSHLHHHTTTSHTSLITSLITSSSSHHKTWQLHFSHLTHHTSVAGSSGHAELRRAWPPLARGCLSCGRRTTQSLLAELRRAWPPLARGWLSCGSRFAPQWRALFRHFLDIATSKSASNMVYFVCFYLEMRFVPQRHALFRHLNYQKWSVNGVFCIFLLRNVLRTITAPDFSSFVWPRTRHFSMPTFRPSRTINHWKNTIFRDFFFLRICIFFLLILFLFFFLLSFLFSLPLPCIVFDWFLNFLWLIGFFFNYIYILYIFKFINI